MVYSAEANIVVYVGYCGLILAERRGAWYQLRQCLLTISSAKVEAEQW